MAMTWRSWARRMVDSFIKLICFDVQLGVPVRNFVEMAGEAGGG